MTLQEIYNNYKEIFILCLEKAGADTGNSSYKNIEKILEKDSEIIALAIEEDVCFEILIGTMIYLVLRDIHGKEKLEKNSFSDNHVIMSDLFDRYLRIPTRRFCSSNGISIINHLDYSFRLIKKDDNEKF